MKQTITLLFFGLIISFPSFAQLVPITAGTMTLCTGGTTNACELDSASTGTWSSSDPAVAMVSSLSGWTGTEMVTGVSAGTATITYTAASGGGYVTAVFTVGGTAPAPITGVTALCAGGTCSLSDATAGGSWTSSSPGVATVGSATGVVTAISAGSSMISYSIGACGVSTAITVGSTVVDSITGPSSVCLGSTITLSDHTAGGVWSSSDPAIASVSATGVVTGGTLGSTDIVYTVTGCGGASSWSFYLTVVSITTAGTISGSPSILAGMRTTLTESVGGGTWSSSNPLVAPIDAVSGNVSGVSAGVATISYTVSGCGASYTATATLTVAAFNGISGYVNLGGTGGISTKVWLITYNPSTLDLEASDSTTIASGGNYYQFTGMPTDSFRIKAAVISGPGDSIYAPTYHTSSFYWHDATVLYHIAGTGDINQNINMVHSSATFTGPGFIGGDVTTGANRGTSTGEPAVGVLVFAINSSGVLAGQTYTDASGHYSFSTLPLGVYTIYPEALNYNTTAYTSISLTGSSHSMTAASFIQHTLSKTFTPIIEGINNIGSHVSSVIVFPNPTDGKLNIQWSESATEKATVSISDITGREIMQTSVNMNEGTGSSILNLSGLTNGIYLITIKSNTINYNSKIELQH